MNYFSHRRFNWIDVVAASAFAQYVVDGQYIAGATILALGLLASVIMESKYGR